MKKIGYQTYARRPFWVIPLAVAVAVAFMPYYVPDAGILRIVVSTALLAMLVVGLNVPFGFGGELAFGQPAVYALGAYLTGYLAINGADILVTLIVSVAATGVLGLLIAVPALRLGSWSVGMVTFFLVLLVPDLVTLLTPITGGPGGLVNIPLPQMFGHDFTSNGYFTTTIAVTIVAFALVRNYIVSRQGAALRVARENPVLARSLGYSVMRLKITAYVIGALPAGAAGCLLAYQDGYISPGTFGFQMGVAIMAASVIGGSDSIYGAPLGAALLVVGPLQLSGLAQYSLIIFGALLVVAAVFFTGGIARLARTAVRRRLVSDDTMPDVTALLTEPAAAVDLPGRDLEVRRVEKAFGGVAALRGVDLTARRGEITALIGPNGSGKTTMLNIISGFYDADGGTLTLGSRDITSLTAHQVAAAGVSRTFQTPLVPKHMTVVETVASARFRRVPTSVLSAVLRLPDTRRAAVTDRREALKLLSLLGIVELADRSAAELPLGTRRIVEVARALAAEPSIVLLDEPASGLDEAEVALLSDVLMRLKEHGATILLVEHNFEMVMSIADRVHVLHLGTMIAEGPPSAVRDHPGVLESYLGTAAATTAPERDGVTAT